MDSSPSYWLHREIARQKAVAKSRYKAECKKIERSLIAKHIGIQYLIEQESIILGECSLTSISVNKKGQLSCIWDDLPRPESIEPLIFLIDYYFPAKCGSKDAFACLIEQFSDQMTEELYDLVCGRPSPKACGYAPKRPLRP